MSKRWNVIGELSEDVSIDKIITLLLENRGIKTKNEREAFLHPNLLAITSEAVGIDPKQLTKAIKRIKNAIENKEQIVVYGDYDVDGITGCAILWETLHKLGAVCMPYIPHRVDEGYGLSIKGITNIQSQIPNTKLIITVDNGIVAQDAVVFANKQGIEVIITDHHTIGESVPDALAIVHTTQLCGAGVAYILAKELLGEKITDTDSHLELAALGTVADLVPLTGANRTIVKEGLKKLQNTTRCGLLALFQQAGIKQDEIGVYQIGYIIGPRLNAAGRLASAMDSLRLLCTKDLRRATQLASDLELTNKQRQLLLKEAAEHALAQVRAEKREEKKILVIGHNTYQEGVIGLIAGKLVEEFYRPAIVLSIGKTLSKASARSISGFNIIEFLRSHQEHFINVGGHPMAAGFTIENVNIAAFTKILEKNAFEFIENELLTRVLKIDCELSFNRLDKQLYLDINEMAPFGMGNPEPVFACRGVTVSNIRVLGKDAQHLKLMLQKDSKTFEAIAFGMGDLALSLNTGDKIDVAYVLDENSWNGQTKLQLKVKDIKTY